LDNGLVTMFSKLVPLPEHNTTNFILATRLNDMNS